MPLEYVLEGRQDLGHGRMRWHREWYATEAEAHAAFTAQLREGWDHLVVTPRVLDRRPGRRGLTCGGWGPRRWPGEEAR